MRATDLAVVPKIRSRQIGETDLPKVADFLARGFPKKPREFWAGLLRLLSERSAPSELPRYGYLLENGDRVVGAVLLLFSTVPGSAKIRCNVSSWFVEEGFRSYASLLVSKALSRRDVTYLNITPAPHTLPIITAQGFLPYSRGVFVALAAMQSSRSRVRVSPRTTLPRERGRVRVGVCELEPFEQSVLDDHAKFGCMSLCCEAPDGTYPFVFRPRLIKRIPCAQLVYCRSLDHFVRCAGPIGRFLLLRGRPFVLIDADGPIRGLLGRYFPGRMPKYFKGPDRPRLGDLAYTETAMFGM
jgi:hypothetical protein